MTKTLDDVLEGPVTISGVLFQYIRPIVEHYLKTGNVKSIERCYDAKTLQRVQRESAEAIVLAIREALPAFYDAQNLFNGRIRPKNSAVLDKRGFNVKRDFYTAYTAFATSLMERTPSKILDVPTRQALEKMVKFDAIKAGMSLDKPLWLGMVTGDTALDSRFPVVLEVVRIKHPARIGAKYARYICEGIIEAKDFKKYERLGLSRKAKEAFGCMHTAGLLTPFNLEDVGLDIIEFLFYRAQIIDVLGVTYVAQTRELARQLLGELQADTRLGSRRKYPLHLATGNMLVEHKDKNRYSYSYQEAYCIDDHITSSQSSDKPKGNNNIFATLRPNQDSATHAVRVDLGGYGLSDYATDKVGGEGSHVRYEASKETEKQKWPRRLQQLDRAISHAISEVMVYVDISQFPLFEGGLQRQNGS